MSGSLLICTEPAGSVPGAACSDKDALRVLQRGFPDQDATFWQRGFERWKRLLGTSNACENVDGHIFQVSGKEIGVLLTLKSDRVGPDGKTYRIINLSSWYIEEAYRWKAPLMLRGVVSDHRFVFTDLTASPEVDRINVALGFHQWSDGMLLAAAAPWAARRSPRAAKLIDLDDSQASLLDEAEYEMLTRHRAVGCLPAILCGPDGASALLFRPIRRKGVVFAQLLYAESRRAVIAHLPAVMRFLLTRGILLLSIDATRDQCPAGTFFRPGRRRFCKGPIDRDRLDYAYSELVVFDI